MRNTVKSYNEILQKESGLNIEIFKNHNGEYRCAHLVCNKDGMLPQTDDELYAISVINGCFYQDNRLSAVSHLSYFKK